MDKQKRLTEIIHIILANFKDLIITRGQYQDNLRKGKNSMAQKNLLHEKYLKKKNLSLLREFQDHINGCVLHISYIANGIVNHAMLTNMSEAEAKEVMELYGKTQNLKIKILEIRKTNTYISKHPL